MLEQTEKPLRHIKLERGNLGEKNKACRMTILNQFCINLGWHYLQVAEPLLPYALAFAAGAMVYVVADDIIPEANSWYAEGGSDSEVDCPIASWIAECVTTFEASYLSKTYVWQIMEHFLSQQKSSGDQTQVSSLLGRDLYCML